MNPQAPVMTSAQSLACWWQYALVHSSKQRRHPMATATEVTAVGTKPFDVENIRERVIALWVAKKAASAFYRPGRNRTGESIDMRDVLTHGLIDRKKGEVWIAGFRVSFPPEMLTDEPS